MLYMVLMRDRDHWSFSYKTLGSRQEEQVQINIIET